MLEEKQLAFDSDLDPCPPIRLKRRQNDTSADRLWEAKIEDSQGHRQKYIV